MIVRATKFLVAFSGIIGAVPVLAQNSCPALLDPNEYPDKYKSFFPLTVDLETSWQLRAVDSDLFKPPSESTLALIELLAEDLSGQNTRLAFVIPPPRSAYNTKSRDPDVTSLYKNLIDGLSTTGAIVPDLLSTSMDNPDFYLRTDTHWSPIGSQTSALLLRDAYEAEVGALASLGMNYVRLDEKIESVSGLIEEARAAICGDEIYREEYRHKLVAAAMDTEVSADALFGDVGQDFSVALVGTSFSAKSKFGWEDGVRFALQTDVENFSIDGGGISSSAQSYFSGSNVSDHVDLIIWEIPWYGLRNGNVEGIVREVLGQFLEPCLPESPFTRAISLKADAQDFINGAEGLSLQDIIEIETPGLMYEGVIEIRSWEINDDNEQPSVIRMRRGEKIAEASRSDVVRAFLGIPSRSGFIAPSRVEVRLPDLEKETDVLIRFCPSNPFLR